MKILTPDKKILDSIYRQFLDQIQDKIAEKIPEIEKRIKNTNLILWKQTKTYNSLLNGDLNHEFGFPKGEAQGRVDAILERVSKSIAVTPKRFSKTGVKKIGLKIRILRAPLHSSIFEMPEATIETEKETSNQFANDFTAFGSQASKFKTQLHWLSWLLKEGNKFIILNYRYEDVVDARSRSGKGLMIPDDTSNWRVPPEFSGTSRDNWLTRALLEDRQFLAGEYGRIINEVLES